MTDVERFERLIGEMEASSVEAHELERLRNDLAKALHRNWELPREEE